jgi:hypothetical protein
MKNLTMSLILAITTGLVMAGPANAASSNTNSNHKDETTIKHTQSAKEKAAAKKKADAKAAAAKKQAAAKAAAKKKADAEAAAKKKLAYEKSKNK